MALIEQLRAYRLTLDPTPAQLQALTRHAGAARWAYNHAIAAKRTAHEEWRRQVDELVAAGVDEAAARAQVRVPVPTKPAIQKALNAAKGDSRLGIEGACPWWWEVSTYAFQSAFVDADQAWKAWVDSHRGQRAGRRVGYPRFKKRGRARDSFRLHHNIKQPTIRAATYRRLQLPRIGEVRLHDSAKRLSRAVAAGRAVIQSVTISRTGHRWYASVLVRQQTAVPDRPTPRQTAAGVVGVDLGTRHLAALSTGELIANPRVKAAHARRISRVARAYARTEKGSRRREKLRQRLGRLHHREALQRAGAAHALTKRLATGWATIVVEDLNVAGMTRSARGTIHAPGRNVRAKSGLNRALVDVAPGELRRQLEYKTAWYGSTLVVADRWYPSSKTCSACLSVKPKLALAERTFCCAECGHEVDRDINAAINLARLGQQLPAQLAVAPGTEETSNARRAGVRPSSSRASGQPALTREDPRHRRGSPRRSDPPVVPTAA
ncbi:RNA-guided endonuclease InsQ/TnpB family protein [Jiangella rhizosphaerae]|uniref:RNA-guided endonuclease InsQ/TnpB family protein n=1 Tax=Jiangella rhizosphaerae TaxID=2293569 RepID=UPI0018F38027|nr:RNA-guided endonuclease TnpB family protein [Jiangella rhizosphaerae]